MSYPRRRTPFPLRSGLPVLLEQGKALSPVRASPRRRSHPGLPPSLPQVGEYFQVQDDYLDFYGDEKVRFGPLPLDILYNCYIDYSRPFYGDEKVIRASTVGGSPQLLHGLQQAPPSAATRSHYQ